MKKQFQPISQTAEFHLDAMNAVSDSQESQQYCEELSDSELEIVAGGRSCPHAGSCGGGGKRG